MAMALLPTHRQHGVPAGFPGVFVAVAALLAALPGVVQAQEAAGGIVAAAAGTRDVETQVIPVPRATSPGSVLRLIYSVINYEDADLRVRLRLVLPDGWRVLVGQGLDDEHVIEAFDEIDGEFMVTVDRDARAGGRQLVRLHAEVVGEAGVYEGQNFVGITRSGGVKPGVVALTGSTTAGVSRVSSGMADARTAGGVALAGRFDRQTTVAFSAGRDLSENLTNYRYNFELVKVTGTFRRGHVDASVGNILYSAGTALTGPFVRGRGATLRKTGRGFIGDLTVSQPTTFDGDASGHLVRGRAGVGGSSGSLALVFSDFSRPAGYTPLLPVVTVLDPDEAERQAIERRLAEGSVRNRVRGGGLEAELRVRRTHRLSARAGALHLENAAGVARTAPSWEGAYGFSSTAATLNLRWRDMPQALQGVSIGGDERWADGTLRLYKDLRLVGQAFRHAHEVTGAEFWSRSSGGSVGTRYMRGATRLELRANYRESAYQAATTRRTGALHVGAPAGPFSLTGSAEIGETSGSRGVEPLAFYRADLRLTRRSGTASFSVSRIETGAQPPMQRVDVLGSVKLGLYELSGGAWATRGYRVGGYPGAWVTAGVPILLDLTAVIGVEYAPLTYTAEPGWRGSLAFRRPLVLPLGFLVRGSCEAQPGSCNR